MGYPATTLDRYPVTRSTGYPVTISVGYPAAVSDKHPDTTSAKKDETAILSAHPTTSEPLSLASTERAQRRGDQLDILEQQATAYVEAIRLRMIAQGISFEVAKIAGDIGPSIWVLVFDRLGPFPPTPVRQVNLRPRLVKSAIEILPRRVQSRARPRGKKKDPQSNSKGSARSRKSPRSRHQKAKRKEVVVDSETSDEEGSVAQFGNAKSRFLEDQMAKMAKELEELKKGKHQGIRKNPLGKMNAPFSKRIREVRLPPKFRMLSEKYSGTKDPISHLESFVHHMEVQNATRETIYLAIRDKGLFRKPGPKKVPADRRNKYKYCDFHKDVRHNTSECYSLRNQIEGLEAIDRRRDREKDLMQQIQVIHTISGGPILAGTSNDSRKNLARMIPRLNAGHEIFTDSVMPMGSKILPVIVGEAPLQQNVMTEFIVVDTSSAYNAILGRPFLSGIRGVLSIYHNVLKFPVGTRSGRSQRGSIGSAQLLCEEIPIRGEDLTKVVKVGGGLDPEVKEDLIKLLREYIDIFAWTHEEMPGIPLSLATHRLAIDATVKPVKQKRRHFNAERNAAVQEEVDKLLKAGFIKGIPISRMDRQCGHDSFPLPKIDQLIDSTAGNKLLSFMDAFSGYNQIMMHPSDQDKTSFITRQGLYCYKVMPFGLKNAGVTYQHMVNKLFKQQIGKSMEVYIDDMITKSLEAEQHPEDLCQTFQVNRKNQMRLNPAKCAFGVTAGKFLGFMVYERGIEANPEKIKAILDLNPPLLVKPLIGEELQLYLAVSEAATSGALVKECSDEIQRPVYYVSCAFTNHCFKFGFKATNNEAEYEALLAGMGVAEALGADFLLVKSDSQLVVNQHKDGTDTPREKSPGRCSSHDRSRRGSYLTNGGSPPTDTMFLQSQGVEILPVNRFPCWMDPIADYLQSDTLPADPDEARKLKRIATRYCLVDGYLYRKGKSFLLRRYLHPDDATWALNEFSQSCEACQKTANLHHLPPERLSSISTPYPFAIWGLDLIGPLPTAPGQAKHAVVVIDYFTRWVETKALVKITKENTTGFVKKNIVCCFSTPMAIITDLGKQFDNANFKEFYEDRNIDLRFASVAHP
ncbi:hypothetical protein QYF36_005345 [Acer negundo]|nr:hypothetical protein QYF36_005345 [Acer negundo]